MDELFDVLSNIALYLDYRSVYTMYLVCSDWFNTLSNHDREIFNTLHMQYPKCMTVNDKMMEAIEDDNIHIVYSMIYTE